MKLLRYVLMLALLSSQLWLWLPRKSYALTADKVWFEFHPGFYRVYVKYTLPTLKVWRIAYAEFGSKRSAEKFYWSLVRGADFSLVDPKKIRFPTPKTRPDPW